MMKFLIRIAAFALILPFLPAATGISPVKKVLDLLEALLVKGKGEQQKEQFIIATFKESCDVEAVETKRVIKDEDEAISMEEADIEKYEADISQLTEYITKHDANLLAWERERQKASEVRKSEAADYAKMHKDYSESIVALKRAISSLRQGKSNIDAKVKEKFMQLAALQEMVLIPTQTKDAVSSFLARDEASLKEDDAELSREQSPGYEFQSEGLIKMLDGLLDKFVQEQTALQKEEVNAKHAFTLIIQDLTDQAKRATADRSDKIATKTDKMKALASCKGHLADLEQTRNEDVAYLKYVVATCKNKIEGFKYREKLRTEEINAISKAIEIVSSDAVSGSSERHLQPMLLQNSPSGAQVQLGGRLQSTQQTSVFRFLQEKALYLGSSELLLLANRVSSDPFKKVRRLISQTLTRLMAEAIQEAEKKGWCDSELATNEQTRKEKTDAVETLQADIDSLKALMAKLGEEIAALTEEVNTLEAAMGKATIFRTTEKATNAAAIEDSEAAQTALSEAIDVLKDFYAKAGEPAVLLQEEQDGEEEDEEENDQEEHEGGVEVPDGPYKGMQAESGGVVGLLEVIRSDFARHQAAIRSGETEAQQDYATFMTASQADKDSKQTDLEHKNAKQQDVSQEVAAKESDLEDTQGELSAALAYFDKLKPSCVNTGGKHAERNERRKEEIQSLQLALKMLNGDDIA